MKFTEFAGDSSIDAEHLHTFLKSWYCPEDIISLIGIPKTGSRKVLSQAQPVERMLEATPEEIETLSYIVEQDKQMSMYMSINPLIEDHKVSLSSRGDKSDVRVIYGTFIDFDISKEGSKEGAFDSKEEILQFLSSVPFVPTIIVDNGISGGVHAYWRIRQEDVEDVDESILVRWWAYISSLTPHKIDKLIDKTRISRMPSGIYWPGDGGKIDTVKIHSVSNAHYRLEDMLAQSDEAYQSHLRKVAALRDQKVRVDRSKWEERVLTRVRENNPSRTYTELQAKVAMDRIDRYIDECFEWNDILPQHGWTFLKENSDGSKTWARPGKSERSAVVDYIAPSGAKSGVMSLLSSSPDTRLEDLKEAGVPLTKKQVMLRLQYDDDVSAMVDDLYERSAVV